MIVTGGKLQRSLQVPDEGRYVNQYTALTSMRQRSVEVGAVLYHSFEEYDASSERRTLEFYHQCMYHDGVVSTYMIVRTPSSAIRSLLGFVRYISNDTLWFVTLKSAYRSIYTYTYHV